MGSLQVSQGNPPRLRCVLQRRAPGPGSSAARMRLCSRVGPTAATLRDRAGAATSSLSASVLVRVVCSGTVDEAQRPPVQ